MSWNPPGIDGTHIGLSLPPRLKLARCKCPMIEAGTLVMKLLVHHIQKSQRLKEDPAGGGVAASPAAAPMLTRCTYR